MNNASNRVAALFPLSEIVALPSDLKDGVDIAIDRLCFVDLTSLPEELCVYIRENETPLWRIERHGEDILAFLDLNKDNTSNVNDMPLFPALAIAARILQKESFPVCDIEFEDTGRHVSVRWQMEFPAAISFRDLMEAVRDSEKAIRLKAEEITAK